MDATVIEEIAEQLGMAVGEASKFIEGILPQYAGLQALESAVALVVSVSLLALVVFGLVRAIKLEDKYEFEYLIVGVLGLLCFFLLVVVGIETCEVLGWALFPEAKLLDMAITAIQK